MLTGFDSNENLSLSLQFSRFVYFKMNATGVRS